ncbi:M3 family oligoendopeptidase [Paenibacillus psychroresistens]|uniref:M3 family oligoendopeptidase n=1 Tax=Paenibacillus psychroresistens TaxID=1778678 RepID=A0A6B8RHB7_9BACL|nr:M3 family oligoendopeptidase [Paenibacillus psychroresistens]QGQ94786.1 M3 family oligoendopeptidase [Paenibacillus psychroresistens]
MQTPIKQTWDLEVIFPGGSQSPQFSEFLSLMEQETIKFIEQVKQVKSPATLEEASRLLPLITILQANMLRFREADSFTSCLMAGNVADKKAVQLNGRVKSSYADFLSALTLFDELLRGISDEIWQSLLNSDLLQGIGFVLDERRSLAQQKLPPEQESLINDLAVDGYHGWGDLYNTTVGRIRIPYEENGKVLQLSAGQAFNKLSNPDRTIRQSLFQQWESTWADQADFCADALNHIAGFRLQLYKRRGWDSVHQEPLAINRMSAETLGVMWEVIEQNKAIFVTYLQRKAKLLGLEKLAWSDVEAPLGQVNKVYSYEEGAQLISEQFRRFSPLMADFAEEAFDAGWIEVEDRSGKRPGGFCTSFPISEQTRIFMTYAGTASNVSTLAHELGHAYHQHVMNDLPGLTQDYAMNVAETASTFAEMIVSDAAVKQATDPVEKLALLEDKIQRAVAFFMNIHARFIFETNFYAERKKGLVSIERLNELMSEAQNQAYNNALSDDHPHFWAAKLHFYLTDVPFYNFPYTFGFLFSAGIYAVALREGAAFEERYIALLRDTGRMTTEQLAMKHLNVDLTKPEFWQSAVQVSVDDVKQFLELTEEA